MKKNKITIAIWSCIGIFLIATIILVPAAQAGEITSKHKIAAPITKMEVIPVPDVKGHVVGVLEWIWLFGNIYGIIQYLNYSDSTFF